MPPNPTNPSLQSSNSDNNDSLYSSSVNWISWHCSLPQNQFLCQIDQQFISDMFNLYGIKTMFDNYNEAIQMILHSQPPEGQQMESKEFAAIYHDATDIYGLIHARYILTPRGQSEMKAKFLGGCFGTCPRVLCQRQLVLPIGMSEQLRTSRVKVFCPRCQQVYMPKKKCQSLDGAYFGISFPHIFMMTYADLAPEPIDKIYVPKVFGFKVYGMRGSKYDKKHNQNDVKELTYYTQEALKKMKAKTDKKDTKTQKTREDKNK